MALQGTLDTFSLPDVLRLLATTGKTGCLHLDGDRGRGSVWIDDGTLVGASSDHAVEGAPIDEVIFEMLRFGRGSFRFAVDERSPHEEQPADLDGTLRRATKLLDEWRELEAVVPSLDHRVAMAPQLTVEQVTIDAERWQALVAIAGGRPVSELGENLGQGELSVTRTVSDLVELGVAVVEAPGPTRGSGRRNVTDIGSRRSAEEAPRRAPRREAASGTEGMPRTVGWSRSGDGTAPGDTDPGDPSGRARYRPEGGGEGGAPRASSSSRLTSRVTGAAAAQATATVTPPSGRPALNPTLATPSTPPAGTAKSTVAAPPRTRSAGTARSSRSRARTTAPHTAAPGSPPAPGGPPVSMPAAPPRSAPVLPTGSALAAAAPELRDDTGGGRLAPGPVPLPPPPSRGPGNTLQSGSLPIPDPPRGPLLPPTLDTGRLGPSPLPTDTGQIPAVAASALPPDLSWAAEDDDAPIAPPLAPLPAPAPPPGPATMAGPRLGSPRHDSDPAPHVVAMSPDARVAVENTVGRAGGGQGGPMQLPGTQEQILGRGHLLHFLATVRAS